jgi:predicted ATPase/DNA-binding SARP family transcriptional activator
VRIGLLGTLQVTDDAGKPVRVGGNRVRALLILLALEADRVISAATLIGRLWGNGDDLPSDAPNALQSLVSRLRSALGPGVIESSPAGYRLSVSPGNIDVAAFETQARDGARALTDGDPETAAQVLREALGLWRGPALADVADAPFATGAAQRLSELRAAATLDRVEADLLLGLDVVPELRALTAADPLAERPRALLMRALAAAGRQAAALAEYREVRELLAGELGVNPSPQLEQVHLDVLRQENFYPERRPGVRRGGLGGLSPRGDTATAPSPARSPSWLTSFVGRDDDVSGVLKKLAEDRLVTLTGPGGVGKTRLAAEVTARLGGPACFTELAPVADPAAVSRAVLGALGLGSRAIGFAAEAAAAAADPLDRLCDALARREIVLVLDNCEHVVSAAATLAERVLADCPRVRVVATSREPLRISGETLWVLPPLPVPAPAPSASALNSGPAAAVPTPLDLDISDISCSPAVRLLRDRGAAVRPGFEVNAANAEAIARICRALDGMPLAIELAAVWLRTLTPAQLAERLDDRFALLTGGSRTALPRHQTLRAVVDWSWELLSEPERVLARRLAVFPVGATLTAAEQVCADDAGPDSGGLPRGMVLPALSGLVAKSILAATDGPDGVPRYRMLETVRAYCLERLAEAADDDYVRAACAAYYLNLAETGDPMLHTAGQGRWFREFTAEQDNMHAALGWAIERGDAETAYRFIRALAYYWVQHGRGDGHSFARKVLAVPADGAERSLRMAEARVICAFLAPGPLFDLAEVRPVMTAAIADLTELSAGDPEIHPVAALVEPMLALYDGNPERAIELFNRYAAGKDAMLRSMGLFYRSRFTGQLGRVAEAEADCRAALEEFRPLGDRYVIAIALLYLAEFAELRADHATAIGLLTEGRAIGSELEEHWVDLWYVDGMLAVVRARAGDLEGARDDLGRASRAMEKVGIGTVEDARTWLRYVAAEVSWRAGDLRGAERCCADVLAAIEGKPTAWWRPYQITVSVRLAMIRLMLGDTGRCRELLAESLRLAADWYEHPPLAASLDATAAFALRTRPAEPGDADAAVAADAGETGGAGIAAKLLGAAHTVRGAFDESSLDAPAARAAAREVLGDAAFDAAYASGRVLPRDAALSLAGTELADAT